MPDSGPSLFADAHSGESADRARDDCPRGPRCSDFRRIGTKDCTLCGAVIDGNHFHDTPKRYRLCEPCLRDAFADLITGRFDLEGGEGADEKYRCALASACQPSEFSMFVDKLCVGCGTYPPAHFHDVSDNSRLCLPCLVAKAESYGLMPQSPDH